jgi:hypothetical protein
VLADEYRSEIEAEARFRVKPGLTVSPEEGAVGTTVTVQGHGFACEEKDIEVVYYLDSESEVIGENIEADDYGWWERSFVIPSSARGKHKIDASGKSSSLRAVQEAFFEVTPSISFDKDSGSPGQSITVTGSGFYARDRYIQILFNGEEMETELEIIRADDNGYWQASFMVPEMPRGTYGVTAEGESTKNVGPLDFEIKPGLELVPPEGHVGTNLTVIGRAFAPRQEVVILYEVREESFAEIEVVTTNNKGSFQVIFAVPESQHGERPVMAEVGGEVQASANFTMESDPPGTPEPISPADGDRVGFIGRVRPTFEWTEVEDLSGVYYSLQIATSANITAGGLADPVVSVSNIVATNYTLNATESLPYGTYYWTVRAVDRAGNPGNWAAPMSFRADVMPLWAFILAIVAIVGGIATAVYFFIMRRRMYY